MARAKQIIACLSIFFLSISIGAETVPSIAATGRPELDLGLLVTVMSAVVALGSFLAIIYKEFLQGPKVRCTIDRITLLRTPPNNREGVTHDIFMDQLLSDPKFPYRDGLIKKSTEITQALDQNDKAALSNAMQKLLQESGMKIDFKPTDEQILKYVGTRALVVNFHLPLVLSNSGRKTAFLRNLVLVAREKGSDRKWVYTPFTTLKIESLLHRGVEDNNQSSDLSRIGGFFVGISIPSGSSVEVHPWFIPIHEVDGEELTSQEIPPGDYDFRLTGYDNDGDVLLKTPWISKAIQESDIVANFHGTDSTDFLTVTKDIRSALRDIK